jgi:hypothetical protein
MSLRTIDRSVGTLISVEYEGSDLTPVTLTEAKLYARVDSDDENALLDILIEESVQAFQVFTGKMVFHQEVTATFQSEGYSIFILPALPVVSITSVKKGDDDIEYDLKGDRLLVDEHGAITVTYEAGLYEDNVSDRDKLGFLKWITSNYNDREDTAGMSISQMPNSSKRIWARHKRYFL